MKYMNNIVILYYSYYLLCCSPEVDNQTQNTARDSFENNFGNRLSKNDSKRLFARFEAIFCGLNY